MIMGTGTGSFFKERFWFIFLLVVSIACISFTLVDKHTDNRPNTSITESRTEFYDIVEQRYEEVFSSENYKMDFSTQEQLDFLKSGGYYFKADVKYPVVSGLNNKNAEESLNSILKYIPFDLLGSNFLDLEELKDGVVELASNENVVLKEWEILSQYKVLCANEEYISIQYEGSLSYPYSIKSNTCFITYDIGEDKIISLRDLYSVDYILNHLERGKFEIVQGDIFLEEKPYLSDIIKSICNDIKYQIEVVEELDKNEEQWIYTTSIDNFGIDDDGVYIRFSCDENADGFMVVKVFI